MTDTPTPRASRPIWLSRLFPFLVWWSRVNRQTMRADILAGITGAIVVLPQGVAFATFAERQDVNVIIFTGGERYFSAGFDLDDIS